MMMVVMEFSFQTKSFFLLQRIQSQKLTNRVITDTNGQCGYFSFAGRSYGFVALIRGIFSLAPLGLSLEEGH
jgi:hypothetical protein